MLLHIRDKFCQKHFPLGLVCLPCLRPLMFQHMVFPVFILCVVFVIAPDMLDQGTVAVAKILPPLVVVRLPLKREVNAELGFVVPAPHMVWLFPFKAFGTVQRLENGVSFMQRHLLTVFQVGAFTPNNCDNRLGCRVMGNGLFRPRNGNLAFHLAFHKIVHVAVLHFVALFAQTVDKLHHLIVVAHGLGILHNQAAFPVAQTRAVLFDQRHQRGGTFHRGRLRHHRLFIYEAVNPIPCLRFFLLCLGPLQRPVVGKDKALCLNGVQRALRHLAGGFHIGVNQGLQHGFHTVGHFLLLLRGQRGKHTVRRWLLGGLFRGGVFLLGLPFLLKL